MQIIETDPAASAAVGRMMTPWEAFCSSVKYWLVRQRRRLPYLVWWDDELDITVTLSQDKLIPSEDIAASLRQLNSGSFAEAERIFSDMGIGFDKGMGFEGRDWEWDWSLQGPISVRFRGRCSRPERRMERPKPQLVVCNEGPT